MLGKSVHYQGKDGFEFLKWYCSKYWEVQTRQVFAQTVTIKPINAKVTVSAASNKFLKVYCTYIMNYGYMNIRIMLKKLVTLILGNNLRFFCC